MAFHLETYEGGFGQVPGNEAQGGTTYCCVACFSLAPAESGERLTSSESSSCVRWLVNLQIGGFQGRTGKVPDACYSFWCGGALKLLGADIYVDSSANATFLNECQFRFGGFAKFPDENPDPFHTYMSLASLAMYPPEMVPGDPDSESWALAPLEALLNARPDRVAWILSRIKRPA